MRKHLVLLPALLLQVAAASVFAQGKVQRIDMSEFKGQEIVTVDEVLVGKIADSVLIFNEDMAFADYVAPKHYDIDMYRSSKVMPHDPLNIDIPGLEFKVDNNGIRQIVQLPEQYYTDVENGHGYVDLGLSVKWATCNIGADSPEKTGGKYAFYRRLTYEYRISQQVLSRVRCTFRCSITEFSRVV